MKRSSSEALRRYHAALSPEERAAWRKRVSDGTTKAMRAWHGQRSPEQKAVTRDKLRGVALCRAFIPGRPGHRFPKGQHFPMSKTPDAIELRSARAVAKTNLLSIVDEVVHLNRDEIRAAFQRGINAEPPYSLPYLNVLAQYSVGKPATMDAPRGSTVADLSTLTYDEIAERITVALEDVRRARLGAESATDAGQLPVIDVTPTSEESR